MQIDNLNKMIYVHIPRTGGSAFTYSWPSHHTAEHRRPYWADGRKLWNMETMKYVDCGRHGTLSGIKEKLKKLEADISDYRIITIVRNPIDRIFSTYRYLKTIKKSTISYKWSNIHGMLDEIEINPHGKVHWFPQTHWLLEDNKQVNYFKVYRFEDIIKNTQEIYNDFPDYKVDKVISRQGNYDYKNNYKNQKSAVERIKKIYCDEHRYMTRWYPDI